MNQEKQPEALRLAKHLEQFRGFPDDLKAAAELRRLHAESEQHLQELRSYRITVENREARIAELEAELAAAKAAPAKLEDIEQYRLQMAGISTAAFGYLKEGDDIHPYYDTLALRDVAKLYAKYDELYKAAHAAQAQRVPLTDAEAIGRISMQQFNADKAKQRVSQARDCQRPECMSRACFGYCMKRITQE